MLFDAEPPVAAVAHLMIGMGAGRAIRDVLAQPPGVVTAPVFGALQLH